MSKIINAIIIGLFGAVCFSVGIYYSTLQFEEQVNTWDSNYQIITDKVYSFEKVSDPKTIRLYVKELNKLLDDMNKLGTLIDGGNELEIVLTNYEKEYGRLRTKVSELIDEVELVEEKLLNQNITLSDFTDVNMEKIDELKRKIDQQRQYTADVKVSVESELKDIKNDVIIIKDSKYGKKIWKVKKK
jgi:vacuolar-type H+-ATPase subunit I/STV1